MRYPRSITYLEILRANVGNSIPRYPLESRLFSLYFCSASGIDNIRTARSTSEVNLQRPASLQVFSVAVYSWHGLLDTRSACFLCEALLSALTPQCNNRVPHYFVELSLTVLPRWRLSLHLSQGSTPLPHLKNNSTCRYLEIGYIGPKPGK